MLLRRLCEYAELRMKMPPTLYVKRPIRYVVELSSKGILLTRQPIDTADPKNPKTKRGQSYLAPSIRRSVGIKPLLLCDNAEYTLGLPRETSRPERVAGCHRAYLEMLAECVKVTADPGARAVLAFLSNSPVEQLDLPTDFDRGGEITFRVDGHFVADSPAIRAHWALINDVAGPNGENARVMQCVVCGQQRPVLSRLQGAIKGVPGGQTSGTSIISANAKPFESYGLEASLIAPTCAECGEKFTKALNELIASPESCLKLGDAAFVFWTRIDVPFNPFTALSDPQPGMVRDLLASVRAGKRQPDVDDTSFYATALSGSGGRTVVRDWIDTTVGQAKRNVAEWFECQTLVGPFGQEGEPVKLYALAASTVRDASRELSPRTPQVLLHAALAREPLPNWMLYQAIRRNRAEGRITHPRAVLIKLVLETRRRAAARGAAGADVSSDLSREDTMIKLNPEHPSPAYHCGRLLAVLEEAQLLAIPGISATIVDRFFGSASSAPASVFARLVRGAQPHLAKLHRDRRGAYVAIQRRLEEVQSRIDGYPRVLTLEEQGLFGLGYYHQRAADRAAATEAAARKRAGLLAETDRVGQAEAELGETLEESENELIQERLVD